MKIVMTGGGSGGHFYPIIAVAEELRTLIKEQKLLEPKLYFVSSNPYSKRDLFDHQIEYRYVMAGKLRRYFSLLNIFDFFKTGFGIMQAVWTLFWIFPDVVFGKGGYASFPTLFAAKLLGIPVIIHESDSAPGRMNAWAAKFAKRIAVSYPSAAEAFPAELRERIAWTGQPVRKEIAIPAKEGAFEYLDLDPSIPVITVLGGSQGAQKINEAIVDALPQLLPDYQIIHQTGKGNHEGIVSMSQVVVTQPDLLKRYRPLDYINDLGMRMAAGASTLIISRAGSTIFEISTWGVPSIIIPIADSNGDHQRKNAFNYARGGGATVIEENNLSTDILVAEIRRIMTNGPERRRMAEDAKQFAKHDAGRLIAQEILEVALEHEK